MILKCKNRQLFADIERIENAPVSVLHSILCNEPCTFDNGS
jgi:hypothetical protein